MNRIIKMVALAALAALATAAVASANVVANPDGTTSIGKGDVQTALGYGSGNDTAFQADAKAGKITFSLAPDTVHYVANIYCSAQNVWQPGDPPMDKVQADMGTIGTVSNKPTVKVLANKDGKVTGYLQTGVTPGDASPLDYSKVDWSKWSTCPAGEHFMGWSDGPTANPFSTVTVPGSGVLTVSGNGKTAELPITPLV
jgi:hypothetical protein